MKSHTKPPKLVFTALTIPHEVKPVWFEMTSSSVIAIEEREYHGEKKTRLLYFIIHI